MEVRTRVRIKLPFIFQTLPEVFWATYESPCRFLWSFAVLSRDLSRNMCHATIHVFRYIWGVGLRINIFDFHRCQLWSPTSRPATPSHLWQQMGDAVPQHVTQHATNPRIWKQGLGFG